MVMTSSVVLRLSICIATRNRWEFLQETIEYFARQMQEGVEMLILDGGSSDDTQAGLTLLTQQYHWLRHVRKENNGGLDADYDASVHAARGEYCWMFSDDDWPLTGALARVFDACRGDHDFVFVDAEVRDVAMGEVFLDRRSKLTADTIIAAGDMNTLFELAGSALSFIGSCVVRRALWLSRDCQSYYGYYFPHIAVLFQRALPASSLLIHQTLVAIRYGNATWTGKALKIWLFLWPSLIWQMPSLSAQAKSSVTPEHPWRSARMMLWQRAKGTFDYAQYGELMSKLAMTPWLRMQIVLISVLPGVLAVWLAVLALLISQRPKRYFIEELRLSQFCQSGLTKRVLDKISLSLKQAPRR